MGNKQTILRQVPHRHHKLKSDEEEDDCEYDSQQQHIQNRHSVSLLRLFEKLELTADGDNIHPGELSKSTFENAFHGPLHKFGKLVYFQMTSYCSASHRERITKDQFVKAGKEILKLHGEKALVKYYFQLFACGKDHLTQEDAKQMFEVSFALTLSLSKILFKDDKRNELVFQAMVSGLFGVNSCVKLEEFSTWHHSSCPEMFQHVHSWLTNILTGSELPAELESSHMPLLDGVAVGDSSICIAVLWLLSTVLPCAYTSVNKTTTISKSNSASAALAASVDASSVGEYCATKDPMVTSMLLLRKLARLPQCEKWTQLYSSERHGMSANRFKHHVMSYHASNITFFTFEGKNKYCLALDTGYREGPSKFGGKDCRLIQLAPVYRVVQSGSEMVRWNESSRLSPNGISVGCNGQAEVLRIPKDFDKINHFGVSCELYKLEVWGCGSEKALENQLSQKKWEAGAVSREQGRKLRPYGESWKDSPDTQILQWGGVNVGNHSYNR